MRTRQAVLPASTVSTVPVMFLALPLSRNSTASATSSGIGKAAQRAPPHDPLAILGRKAFGHVGVDEAGRHGVDGDSRRAHLARERVRHADKRSLGRAIGGEAAEAGRGGDRRDSDDAPAAAPAASIARTTCRVRMSGDSVLSRTARSISASRIVARRPLGPMAALLTRP